MGKFEIFKLEKHFIGMKKQFDFVMRIIMILFVVMFSSCISCHRETENEKPNYSVYEVNIKSSLNVRLQPTSSSEKIGTLYNNDKVHVVDINDGWAKIEYGSQYAYVSAQYLVLVDEEVKLDSIQQSDIHDENKYVSSDSSSHKVLFFDQAHILSNEDYATINQAYANLDVFLIVWTVESIDKGDIIDYNNQILDILEEEPYEAKIKAVKPEDMDDDAIYLVTYVKDLGLMQVANDSRVMNVIDISMPKEFLHVQLKAQQKGLEAGLMDLSSLINEATLEYKSHNWLIRFYIDGASLGEMITESLLKEQVLPSDSFFYKYIFSWATKIPRNFLNFLIATLGSLSYAMMFLCLLLIVTLLVKANIVDGGYNGKTGEGKRMMVFFFSIIVYSFLFVCVVILFFYTMCNMADIIAMRMYGWNNEMIATVTEHNLNLQISRSWWLSLLFFVGMFIYKLPNSFIIVSAFLPSKVQHALAKNNPTHFEEESKFLSKPDPYTELFSKKTGDAIGETLIFIIILTFLLNGTSMMYGVLFTCALMIGKIYSAIKLYLNWKSKGYFNS